jgi:hypothetical protein
MNEEHKRVYKLVVRFEGRQLEHVGFEGSRTSIDIEQRRTQKESETPRQDPLDPIIKNTFDIYSANDISECLATSVTAS